MRASRTIVYGLIAVLIASAVGSGLASGAHKKKIKTRVTINFQGSDYGDSFRGKVKAKGHANRKLKRKCAKRRKVTVFRKRPGGRQRIGSTRSNRRGRWVVRVNGMADPGRYHARAKRKAVRYKGNKYICKKGRSRGIRVS